MDGQDIRATNAATYRQPIALVSQEPTLFEGTIRSNLLLGLPPHLPTPSDKEIEAATSAASLHSFIASLPESYSTPLSSATHASLSGGQKQRLCIARALLRKPRLLLLDEATSSLDSHSEREVQAAIENVVEGKQMTVVVVAHRLSTVQRADRIFVLGEGDGKGAKVVESGTHTELVGRKGTYWAMVSTFLAGEVPCSVDRVLTLCSARLRLWTDSVAGSVTSWAGFLPVPI
jgi:ATP-binding cassette subfamily B (MDR/TAP) protein 1